MPQTKQCCLFPNLVQSGGHMETLTKPTESSNSPKAAAASPSWVMLKRYDHNGDGDSSVITGDAKSAAICRTTTGWLIRISPLLAAPPATSSLHSSWVGDAPADDEGPSVLAAHDNVVLFQMRIPRERRGSCTDTNEYFLYDAGGTAAGARLPALSLLPACYTSMQFERKGGARRLVPRPCNRARFMRAEDTGVLRRHGEDDGEVLLVAQLEVAWDAPRDTAELCLCVLRRVITGGGPCEWDLKRLPIVHGDGSASGEDALMLPWKTDAVGPAGDRFMCWVDYFGGILLCDMSDDQTSTLVYVPLPVEPDPDTAERRHSSDRPYNMQSCRALTGAGTASALRFVSVDRRCCCGAVGESKCARSRFAFMVTTWTMSLLQTTTATAGEREPMAWVKNSVFECDELWALPGYGGLPRMPLELPVVSSDDPDVVCFLLSNDYRGCGNLNRPEDDRLWTVMVNTRSKTLLSVLPQDTMLLVDTLVPAKLSIQ